MVGYAFLYLAIKIRIGDNWIFMMIKVMFFGIIRFQVCSRRIKYLTTVTRHEA
jgi:hypothetical protein